MYLLKIVMMALLLNQTGNLSSLKFSLLAQMKQVVKKRVMENQSVISLGWLELIIAFLEPTLVKLPLLPPILL